MLSPILLILHDARQVMLYCENTHKWIYTAGKVGRQGCVKYFTY